MSLCRNHSISVVLLIAFIFSSCESGGKQMNHFISVSAATSLTDALETIAHLYNEKTGVEIQLNFASSSTCARQISQGMESKIFLSANREWVDYLSDISVEDSNRVILVNTLVIVAPVQSPIVLSQLDELIEPSISRIAMGDPTHVPAGLYGKKALEMNDLWTGLENKIVGAMDVRAALSLAASQAVDCAIVYKSDAMIDDAVEIAYEFPPGQSPAIEYYSCRIGESEAADLFYSFLFGEEAKEIFRKYGFEAAAREGVSL